MIVEPLALPEVLLLRPRVFHDARGHFVETWNAVRYREAGIRLDFAQDNVSVSHRGVLRGLHVQHPNGQGKLVTVLQGRVFDVAVDVRAGSPRYGQWVGAVLDGDSKAQLWVPPGFLHGFLALEDHTIFSYKCTALYNPAAEFSVRWNDPAIGIAWPGMHAGDPFRIADKDAHAPLLAEVARERLPRYQGPAVPR
jgi:dTDP-4-dehydrorhamnose 3,5-epimerase